MAHLIREVMANETYNSILKHLPWNEAVYVKDFKMKRGASGQITLAAKQEGKFCGACHDGKTQVGGVAVFPIDECDRCHAP